MILPDNFIAASRLCLEQSMPFAIVLHPDETEASFYAAESTIKLNEKMPMNWLGFIVSSFGLGQDQQPEGIEPKLTADQVLSMTDAKLREQRNTFYTATPVQSTKYSDYESAIKTVTSALIGIDGKTVISRLEVVGSENSPFTVAEKYFSMFLTCFRSIYFTPSKGLWIVATPEVLLDYNRDDSSLSTMSLAGTREIGDPDWDEKNMREHELVTGYITDVLTKSGMIVNVQDSENLRFGKIEHLCNRIQAVGQVSPMGLALKLSPTPAVCGWPVEDAYDAISRLESHSRMCYGGFIGTYGQRTKFYVNLRCCRVEMTGKNGYRYFIFAGGGINGMSRPKSEWNETENKMAPLRNIITKLNNSKIYKKIQDND